MIPPFKNNHLRALEKQIRQRYADAVALLRSGKLREYASTMAEIQILERQLELLPHKRTKDWTAKQAPSGGD